MSKNHIIAIDQSTSGTKGILVNNRGQIIKKISLAHRQIYPKPGWVEHDPIEIYENVKKILNQLVNTASISIEQVSVLTITNQRETVVVWDRETGKPIYNAIVWQCKRSTKDCQNFVDKGYDIKVKSKTGLTLDPYFSATKVKWILDNVKGAKVKASQGRLLLGTIDSWLIWNLTKGKVHATDVTNASRTLLYNIYTLTWDDDLLEIFDIPKSMLPKVKYSDEIYGRVKDSELSLQRLLISGVIGDSQAALFGQRCFDKGMAKATFGTGTSVMAYTGELVEAKNGLVTSVAWGFDGNVSYCLEGIINTTGDIIKWMKEDLDLFDDFSEAEQLASNLSDNQGVYLVPAFVGLGAPYWSPKTRAAITGINRNTNKSHFVRAGLESIVYQVKDVIKLVNDGSHTPVKELRVDGGAITNHFLMQFLADILNVRVLVSDVSEVSTMGSVFLGGLGIGVWNSVDEINQLNNKQSFNQPEMAQKLREQYYLEWKKAVHKLLV